MRILLTNDDGVYAPGLRALRKALQTIGDVTVVAPLSEQSAAGHSITLLTPLVVHEIFEGGERIGYAVDGKPADCVKLAIVMIMKEEPDVVISGINAGSNAGINVLYSGTVAAAIEGAFLSTLSMAVSLEFPEDDHFPRAAELALEVIKQILAKKPAKGELFNINIPTLSKGEPRGVRVLPQGLSVYRETYEERIDPRGRRYFWLLPDLLYATEAPHSDIEGLADRYVTVTPLHFDLTKYQRLAEMKEWGLKLATDS